MNSSVIIFPGSNCDRDMDVALNKFGFKNKMIWHNDSELPKSDLVVLPGGDRKLEHMVNHYSIMNTVQWGSLLLRSGFDYTTGVYDLNVTVKDKPYKEPYDWYMAVKLIERNDFSPANGTYMAQLKDNLIKGHKELGNSDVKAEELPIDKK